MVEGGCTEPPFDIVAKELTRDRVRTPLLASASGTTPVGSVTCNVKCHIWELQPNACRVYATILHTLKPERAS